MRTQIFCLFLLAGSVACNEEAPRQDKAKSPPPPPRAAKQTPEPKSSAVVAVSFVRPGAEDKMSDWVEIEAQLKKRPGYRQSVLLATRGKAPFTFLNLAVWSSAASIEATLATERLGPKLKAGSETAWYSSVDQVGSMKDSTSGANIVVVPLEVAADQVSAFRARFKKHREFFIRMPGFEAFSLLHKIGGNSAYNYVLAARWSTVDDFDKAVLGRGIDNILPDFPEAKKAPGLYIQTTK